MSSRPPGRIHTAPWVLAGGVLFGAQQAGFGVLPPGYPPFRRGLDHSKYTPTIRPAAEASAALTSRNDARFEDACVHADVHASCDSRAVRTGTDRSEDISVARGTRRQAYDSHMNGGDELRATRAVRCVLSGRRPAAAGCAGALRVARPRNRGGKQGSVAERRSTAHGSFNRGGREWSRTCPVRRSARSTPASAMTWASRRSQLFPARFQRSKPCQALVQTSAQTPRRSTSRIRSRRPARTKSFSSTRSRPCCMTPLSTERRIRLRPTMSLVLLTQPRRTRPPAQPMHLRSTRT